MDESILSNRLNVLQAEMLDFHESYSPVKKHEDQIRHASTLMDPKTNRILLSFVSVFLAILKVSVCITGPTVFPTVIYCLEGNSQLFWQATAISGIIALLLILMFVSMVCTGVEKVGDTLNQAIDSAGTFLWDIPILRYLYEATSSDFAQQNSWKVVYPLVVLCTTSLVTLVAYVKNLPLPFLGSLMIVSFVLGVLSTNVVHLLNSPAFLPIRSPRKVQLKFTTPSPKKDLDFPPFERSPAGAGTLVLSSPLAHTTIDYDLITTQPITAYLPRRKTSRCDRAENKPFPSPYTSNFYHR